MSFLLASNNPHKLRELSSLKVESASRDLKIEESGTTFFENARLKAQGYFEYFKRPTVADDSGLVVNALPEQLGVKSARFGGGNLSDAQKNQLLLEKLEGEEDRSAYFVCVLCFYLNEKEIFFFEGRLSGVISREIKGNEGFGFDPVFIPLEFKDAAITLAMLPDYKAKNSHRARAINLAKEFFTKRNCQIL